MSCESLLKAIDAYIRKADDSMEEELKEAGYVEPKETAQALSELEEQIADTLKDNTDTLLDNLLDADDLQQFADEIRPKFKKNDKLDQNLQRVFYDEMIAFLPELINQYAK